MTCSDTTLQNSTNINMKTCENMNVGSVKNLRASKLIELCQAKLESLEENMNLKKQNNLYLLCFIFLQDFK